MCLQGLSQWAQLMNKPSFCCIAIDCDDGVHPSAGTLTKYQLNWSLLKELSKFTKLLSASTKNHYQSHNSNEPIQLCHFPDKSYNKIISCFWFQHFNLVGCDEYCSLQRLLE